MTDINSFEALSLKPALLGNLADLGYHDMTAVQQKALPVVLAGDDVVARARTGSGKTAAFGLGLLNKLDATNFQVQALVLCPTRELADQVAKEIRRLARAIPNIKILSLCGGVALGPQISSLQHHPHVLVGTPGRILKHLRKGTVLLKALNTLVLDEADRMLDMGFSDEVDAILEFIPTKRQTLLFSATYPPSIAEISQRVQRKPVTIDVTDDEQANRITQFWCPVNRSNRNEKLLQALQAWGGELNLVFCNTKLDCAEVAAYLQQSDIKAVALHGDLDQPRRNQVLVRFANRSASVLIATDVAARGLDVKDIDVVFNYELPSQTDIYVHRIGRTGRAGKQGTAVSLVDDREKWRLDAIIESGAEIKQQRPPADGGSRQLEPVMTTIQINGGRRNKLRPGDLLGALTADGGVDGKAVGAIDIFDDYSYVAIHNKEAKTALRQLSERPIKGRRYRAHFRK